MGSSASSGDDGVSVGQFGADLIDLVQFEGGTTAQ